MSQKTQKIIVFFMSILVGLMIFNQYQAYEKIGAGEIRESETNIFRIINIYLQTNKELKNEADALESEIENYKDDYTRIKSFEKTMDKNEILAGEVKVKGKGLRLTLTENVVTMGLVDLINELWNAGAEVVAVNGIRLTEETSGFAEYGSQITLSGMPLQLPLLIEAIGENETMVQALEQSGGVIFRLQKKNAALKVNLEIKEMVEIGKAGG